jgi:cytochrome c1
VDEIHAVRGGFERVERQAPPRAADETAPARAHAQEQSKNAPRTSTERSAPMPPTVPGAAASEQTRRETDRICQSAARPRLPAMIAASTSPVSHHSAEIERVVVVLEAEAGRRM